MFGDQRPEEFSVDYFNQFAPGALPSFLGFEVTQVENGGITIEFEVQAHHLAPHGYLHGGTVSALADTCAGYGSLMHVPKSASGFTTIEFKVSFLGTARQGRVAGIARPLHIGNSTHVWDVDVRDIEKDKTIARFSCTQLVLYPRQN